jgi:hypothetical protein
MNSEWEVNESVWINGLGASANFIYLVLFLVRADHTGGRWNTLVISIAAAFVYLILTVVSGYLFRSTVTVQWLCMLAGLASACAPLFLTYFVV